jgi:hypothetical protein
VTSGPRPAVAAVAGILVVLQMVSGFGALVTGGVVVMLLAGASLVLVLRPRPRGWLVAGGLLGGVGIFVLPWSLFVAQQTREAGQNPGVWPWATAIAGILALGAAAWMLSGQPRPRLRLDRARVTNLAGGVTVLGGVAAAGIAGAAVVSRNLGLALGMSALAWVLLRTLRAADPGRHLADVTVAAGLLACLLWWVFVGTLQGATGGIGMLAVVGLVFLALVSRAGKAADAVPPSRPLEASD